MFIKKILIDLDGVLNEYGREKFDENVIPKIKDGAKEFVETLSKSAELYLFTTRNLKLATKWLTDNDLDKYFKDVTNIKSPNHIGVPIGKVINTDKRKIYIKLDSDLNQEDGIRFLEENKFFIRTFFCQKK